MNRSELFDLIQRRQSFLCVGLDPDPDKLPAHLNGDAVTFCKEIIDATRPYAMSYKPNFAFFEALGIDGYQQLAEVMAYIGDDHFLIADAKRGDIDHSSGRYAKAVFEVLGADAVTVNPYLGYDSVAPFLAHQGKWTVLLAVTTNRGSADFQFLPQGGYDEHLYTRVMRRAQEWASPDQLMFVCGGTHPDLFTELRTVAPHNFFLVPGIGHQGGDLEEICRHGMNDHCGLIATASRSIIYASQGEDYAEAAAAVAKDMQQRMVVALEQYLPA